MQDALDIRGVMKLRFIFKPILILENYISPVYQLGLLFFLFPTCPNVLFVYAGC
jgi:hypothetical protein